MTLEPHPPRRLPELPVNGRVVEVRGETWADETHE